MDEDDIILRAPGQNPQAPTLAITERRTRYDDVIENTGAGITVPTIETQAPRSKYDDVVDRLEENRNRLLDATISGAVKQDPNKAGEAQRLAAETGVPADIAARNIEELRQRAIEQRIRQMKLAQTNPVLARQMRDPEFAAIAYDQVENLSTTESIFKWFREIPEDIGIGWEAGRLTTELGYLGERAMTGQATDQDMARIGSLQQRLQELRGSQGFLEAAAKILGQQADTLPDALTYGAATGLTTGTAALIAGQAGPQIAVPEEIVTVPSAAIGGFFAGTMAKMGEQSYRIEAGHAYLDMIEAGVDRNVAINVGAGVGLVNAGLEVVGLSFIGRPLKSALTRAVTERVSESLQQATMRTALRNFGINYGLAIGAETTTEVIQEMTAIAGLELGKRLSDADMESLLSSEEGRQEIADRLVGAFEEVAKGMAVLALPGAGFNFRYDYRRAQESKKQQEFFQSLNNAAASSEVRNRNPGAYERFIEAQADGTPVENIYVDARQLDGVLNQSGVSRDQLAAVLPDVAAQLDEAVATGGDVVIPTSQYAARVAGTDIGNAMMDHVRVTPEGMSAAEARQFQREQQALMDEAKAIMDQQAVKDDTFVKGAQEVRQQVLDQIKGAKTYTDKVARTYADMVRDFVVTQSAALNMNPRDFYEQYMYRVQAAERARMGEAQLFDQAGQVMPDTDAFQGFYGRSVFRDSEGKPQVLYHGTADDVSAFDLDHPNRKDSGWLGTGVYLTDNPDLAEIYADQKARALGPRGQNVMQLYARLENPYYATLEEKAQIRAGGREAADAFTQRLQQEGYDGVILQAAPDAQEIVVFDPAAVKSVFNDGTWSRDDANLLAQRGRAQQLGRVVPDTVTDVANVESAFEFASTQQFKTNRDFKLAIQKRVLDAAKAAKVDLSQFTQNVERYLVQVATADAFTALETNPNAVGWYNEKVTKALRIMSLVHPEVATDPQAKFAFTWAMAVTSNGLKVDKNFELAERAYRAFKETGRMPTDFGAGTAQIAINEGLDLYNRLVDQYGIERVMSFMTTRTTVKEVEEFTGKNVSGENLTTEVYGAAALGPKIGNGFFANLYGHFEQLTMDRWLMRTWGRWTGTLVEENKANIKIKRDQLKSMIQAMTPADKKAFEAIIKTKLAVGKLDEVAVAINKASTKPANRKAMAEIGSVANNPQLLDTFVEILGPAKKGVTRASIGDEIRKVGNSLSGYLDGQKEAPSGPPERARIRQVMNQVLTELQQSYPELTMSDLQALLWYPEKRLYDSAKTVDEGVTGYDDNEAPDYANAAAALAEQLGVPQEQINQTIQEVDNELQLQSAQRAARTQRPDGDGLLRQGARIEGEPTTVIFEVAPDPNNFALANRWRSLGNAERLDASNRVAQEIVPAVLQAAGAEGTIVGQIGSYLDDTNPSFAIKLTKGDPVEVAKGLGFVLSQDSMMVMAPKAFEGSFQTGAIRINVGQQTDAQIDQIYQSLRGIQGFPQIQGQTTTEGFMSIMLDPSVDAAAMANAIDETLGGAYTVDFASIYAAFPEKQEYDYASEQNDPTGSAGLARQRYRDARTEAAASLNRAILAVERGRAQASRARAADAGTFRQLGAPGVRRLRAGDLEVGKQYGTARDGATAVRGVHYSRNPRATLAGKFYGSGLRGAESRRLEQTDDQRIKQRVHFYVDTGNGIRPEAGVGGYVHAVDLSNVYDIGADPLGFMQQRTMPFDDMGTWFNEIESMVVDAGFDGIYVPKAQSDQGVVVLLGPNVVEVDVLGTQADVLNEQEIRNGQQENLAQGAGLEQTGDGAGRYSGGGLAPLEGAPSVPGFSGPDPRLVAVAEQYARDNGIDLKRQSEYVEVDPARAKRIADAYEAMQHSPNDPVVREAYENLIAQTRAQYDALVAAGYRFWFTDLNIPDNVEYLSTPWNAMRDIRANQTMGVFPTDDGFGSGDFDPAANPLLADTGLQWPVGGPDGTTMKTVYANDLFRAVHDAFGHGLEGSGFRARGEENAWQAHVRLFTGSAVGAITSETRGQNSWLNFGPNGEANQTAKVEDTVFADQKTGLMPEWTWTEGRAGDMIDTEALRQASQADAQRRAVLDQQARGGFDPRKLTTILNEKADYSTFLHETAHFFLTVYADMANMPNATQQMRDDMQTVLDWFGVKDLATWNAMSLDEQRKYHESFAYNFEIYLFEGKAPSIKMQSMFDKFATWLRTVYTSIRDELNAIYRAENGADLPILTGEVRQVMDRMLASEEQIQQAQQVRNMMPTFQSQEQSGMSDAEWAAYQDMLREAEEMAVTDLTRASVRQMKWLSNARSRVIKDLQKEADTLRKQIGAEVAEEVKQLPVYRAMEFLKRGRTVDENGNEIEVLQGSKMSIDSVNALYPESATGLEAKPDLAKLGYGKYGMLAKEGLPAEIVAEMFGFKSPDTMIRALLDAKPLKEEIDARTDQRMLEEHGDLNNPAAMEQAVEQALHNEARARFVAVELRYLAKSTAPVRVMTAAAKQVASQIISAKIIKEIKPRDYSVAEARASRESQAASKKGSTVEAARAKQNQLVQNQLAAQAVAARQEVQKAIADFRKLFKADDRLAKTRNMDLVNAARSIVAYYGLGRKGKPPTAYIEQLRAYNPDMYNDIAPLIQDAATGAKNYTDLTMDEFRMMRDTVEALWFQSKREKQIMIEGKAMDLDEAVGELNSRLEQIGIPGQLPGELAAPSTKDRVVRQINVTKAILRRVEHWADSTDGPKGIGPFTKYIWRPVREALDKYRAERNIYVKRYVDLVRSVELPPGKIESNELGYTFGNANGGLGKAELLGALLHTGNESNLRKLLVGRGWGKINDDGTLDASRWYAFQQRMIDEGKITKADFDWAQKVWDLTEEMKPMAQQAHKDIFGYYFKEVEATPLSTPFGVYRGGYVPAKTDPFMVRDAQKNAKIEELEGDFRNAMPSTGMGFTKGRVEYNQPLSLDIRIMTKHIDDVIRFAFVQPAIKDVLKIVRDKDFANNLSRIDPSAIEEMLLPWLNRAARQITMEPGMHKAVDTFWQGVRNRTGIAIMFANITNALQQVTGYFPALLKVQAKYMKTSLALYMRNPHKTAQEIAELSPFMDDRMNNRMFELQELMNEILLNPTKFDKMQQWSQRHGYFLQQAFQNQVDSVVWMAKYNEVLATLGKDVSDVRAQKEAITQADAAVRMTQDSYAVEDVAAFQVGSPFYKTFTQFAGYFNMLANLNGSEYVKVMRDLGWRGNKGKLFSIYLLGFAAPMLISEAIVKTLAGDWDDDDEDGYIDEIAEWFFMSQIRGAVAGIPAFGPGLLAIGNAFNDKPYDDRMTTSPSVSMLEGATIGVAKAGINIVDPEKEVTGKNVRDVLTLLSLITGIPLVVLGRPIGYAIDVERGKIDPTSDADYVRGLITGKASEASR